MPTGFQTFDASGRLLLDTTSGLAFSLYEYTAGGREDHTFTVPGIANLIALRKAFVVVENRWNDGSQKYTISGDSITVKLYTNQYQLSTVSVWRWG